MNNNSLLWQYPNQVPYSLLDSPTSECYHTINIHYIRCNYTDTFDRQLLQKYKGPIKSQLDKSVSGLYLNKKFIQSISLAISSFLFMNWSLLSHRNSRELSFTLAYFSGLWHKTVKNTALVKQHTQPWPICHMNISEPNNWYYLKFNSRYLLWQMSTQVESVLDSVYARRNIFICLHLEILSGVTA